MSFECLDCKAIDGGYCEDCATPNDDIRELAERMQGNANSPQVSEPAAAEIRKYADEQHTVIDGKT